MPRFDAFPALRYDTSAGPLDHLVAPPYDVLSAVEADSHRARSAHNIVHIDVPVGGDDRYVEAGCRWRSWIESGVLVADERPSLTIYRTRFTDEGGSERDLAGVIGALEVVDDGAGGVLPHERTTPKASTDRFDLTRATAANLSPVWGLSLAGGLTELLREPGESVGAVTVDGVTHAVERVDDPARVAAITSRIAADDVLIADGHHRYGVARTYRDEVRAAGHGDGAAELTLAYVGELVAEQLSVAAIHRLYRGVPFDEVAAALERSFGVTPMPAPTAATLQELDDDAFLVLLGRGGAWRLDARARAFEGVRALDGAWLEHALYGLSVEVDYQHGLAETVAAVEGGSAEAAVLIRPVSVDEIERTAREGLLMPPKSTFFTPKLRTGFVMRSLDRDP